MNDSINPCEDPWVWACEKWIYNNKYLKQFSSEDREDEIKYEGKLDHLLFVLS